MAGSMAMWFESHKQDHFESKSPEAELHFNLWRHPDGPQKDQQFLDIGLLLSSTYELGRLYFYIPVSLAPHEVEDLSPKLHSNTMLSAVFNDVIEVDSIKDEFLIAKRNGAHYLTIYHIGNCGGMELTTMETDGGGTLIGFSEKISSYLRSSGPHYIRFRVRLDQEKAKAFSYQRPGITVTSPEAATAEFTELRFNEFRNLPAGVMARVGGDGGRLFRVTSAHCFLLRDMKYELVASHSTIHKMRRLEAQLWKGYLPPNLDDWLDNILVYHWKSIAPVGGDVGSFVALAKFKRLDDKFLFYLIGIVLLGAMGSLAASWVNEFRSADAGGATWHYAWSALYTFLMFVLLVLFAYLWQPLKENFTRIKGRIPFLRRRAS